MEKMYAADDPPSDLRQPQPVCFEPTETSVVIRSSNSTKSILRQQKSAKAASNPLSNAVIIFVVKTQNCNNKNSIKTCKISIMIWINTKSDVI